MGPEETLAVRPGIPQTGPGPTGGSISLQYWCQPVGADYPALGPVPLPFWHDPFPSRPWQLPRWS